MELKKGSMTAVCKARGAELTSLRNGDGVEYIWQGDPAYWAGRNPVLFPIVGSLREDTVDIGGQRYQMGRHGFARRSDFSLTEQGNYFAAFTLRENEDTLRQFPFPFSLEVRHTLLEDGFSTAFTVVNTGDAPMPFCIGAHTGFCCPLLPGERFEDYKLVFEQREYAWAIPMRDGLVDDAAPPRSRLEDGVLPLSYLPFDREDTLIFDGLRSKEVSLVHGGTGQGVKVRFDGFPMLAFWTPPHKNAPFICIEPWHGCAALLGESGRFEDKRHCVTLRPGEEKRLKYTVTLV